MNRSALGQIGAIGIGEDEQGSRVFPGLVPSLVLRSHGEDQEIQNQD